MLAIKLQPFDYKLRELTLIFYYKESASKCPAGVLFLKDNI
jgi:hypothetical protein